MAGRAGVGRAGAGRPAGSKNKRTIQFQRILDEKGLTPLQVWTATLADLWRLSQRPGLTAEQRADYRERACAVAKMMAPYVHPRLQSIQLTGDPNRPLHHAHSAEDILQLLFGRVVSQRGNGRADQDEAELPN